MSDPDAPKCTTYLDEANIRLEKFRNACGDTASHQLHDAITFILLHLEQRAKLDERDQRDRALPRSPPEIPDNSGVELTVEEWEAIDWCIARVAEPNTEHAREQIRQAREAFRKLNAASALRNAGGKGRAAAAHVFELSAGGYSGRPWADIGEREQWTTAFRLAKAIGRRELEKRLLLACHGARDLDIAFGWIEGAKSALLEYSRASRTRGEEVEELMRKLAEAESKISGMLEVFTCNPEEYLSDPVGHMEVISRKLYEAESSRDSALAEATAARAERDAAERKVRAWGPVIARAQTEIMPYSGPFDELDEFRAMVRAIPESLSPSKGTEER